MRGGEKWLDDLLYYGNAKLLGGNNLSLHNMHVVSLFN
jgi:hypothetical protein